MKIPTDNATRILDTVRKLPDHPRKPQSLGTHILGGETLKVSTQGDNLIIRAPVDFTGVTTSTINGVQSEEREVLSTLVTLPISDAKKLSRIGLERLVRSPSPDSRAHLRESFPAPIHFAAVTGDLNHLKQLVQSGDNVNYRTSNYHETPLHLAMDSFGRKQDRFSIVKFLIDNGADVNTQDIHGITPLFKALSCRQPDLSIVKSLLDAGANPDVTTILWLQPGNVPPSDRRPTIREFALDPANKIPQEVVELFKPKEA